MVTEHSWCGGERWRKHQELDHWYTKESGSQNLWESEGQGRCLPLYSAVATRQFKKINHYPVCNEATSWWKEVKGSKVPSQQQDKDYRSTVCRGESSKREALAFSDESKGKKAKEALSMVLLWKMEKKRLTIQRQQKRFVEKQESKMHLIGLVH